MKKAFLSHNNYSGLWEWEILDMENQTLEKFFTEDAALAWCDDNGYVIVETDEEAVAENILMFS
jgi:hypothetical protein